MKSGARQSKPATQLISLYGTDESTFVQPPLDRSHKFDYKPNLWLTI